MLRYKISKSTLETINKLIEDDNQNLEDGAFTIAIIPKVENSDLHQSPTDALNATVLKLINTGSAIVDALDATEKTGAAITVNGVFMQKGIIVDEVIGESIRIAQTCVQDDDLSIMSIIENEKTSYESAKNLLGLTSASEEGK